eukprot:tig00000540_g1914.t1
MCAAFEFWGLNLGNPAVVLGIDPAAAAAGAPIAREALDEAYRRTMRGIEDVYDKRTPPDSISMEQLREWTGTLRHAANIAYRLLLCPTVLDAMARAAPGVRLVGMLSKLAVEIPSRECTRCKCRLPEVAWMQLCECRKHNDREYLYVQTAVGLEGEDVRSVLYPVDMREDGSNSGLAGHTAAPSPAPRRSAAVTPAPGPLTSPARGTTAKRPAAGAAAAAAAAATAAPAVVAKRSRSEGGPRPASESRLPGSPAERCRCARLLGGYRQTGALGGPSSTRAGLGALLTSISDAAVDLELAKEAWAAPNFFTREAQEQHAFLQRHFPRTAELGEIERTTSKGAYALIVLLARRLGFPDINPIRQLRSLDWHPKMRSDAELIRILQQELPTARLQAPIESDQGTPCPTPSSHSGDGSL